MLEALVARSGTAGCSGVIVLGLVLGVLAFVFQSPALYVLAALAALSGTWRMIGTSR